MKGNEAIAEAALRAGCQAYFGYPITPQNEIPEYMSREMPNNSGIYLQAESELAAINMVLGASASGARVMTSSSGPGICLKLEGISSMCITRLPAVIVDVVRSGPGMGDLAAAQEDYKMAGNGAYKIPTFLPSTVQEAAQMTFEAFDIADQYRTPVMILADGMIGQMMEGVDFDKLPARRANLPEKTWRMAGTREKGYRTQMSLHPDGPLCYVTNMLETQIYPEIIKNETKVEITNVEDADIVFVAYGTAARMAKSVIMDTVGSGIKIGIIRPMTAWPFAYDAFNKINPDCKAIIVPEINIMGQMIDDVKIAASGRWPVYHCGNTKAGPMNTDDIAAKLNEVWEEVK
jgi:2-oxoglutarate ferredoxin oxidoreductase subunit alpha